MKENGDGFGKYPYKIWKGQQFDPNWQTCKCIDDYSFAGYDEYKRKIVSHQVNSLPTFLMDEGFAFGWHDRTRWTGLAFPPFYAEHDSRTAGMCFVSTGTPVIPLVENQRGSSTTWITI